MISWVWPHYSYYRMEEALWRFHLGPSNDHTVFITVVNQFIQFETQGASSSPHAHTVRITDWVSFSPLSHH